MVSINSRMRKLVGSIYRNAAVISLRTPEISIVASPSLASLSGNVGIVVGTE
jgi:hypothetical protein